MPPLYPQNNYRRYPYLYCGQQKKEEYENSLKRFHRCVETAHKAHGTGLGFSIVQRIAAIHNADLILGVSSLGGLKVTVLFPLPNKRVEMRKTAEKKTGFF